MAQVLCRDVQAICPHGATACALPSQVRVTSESQPILVQSDVLMISGCAFTLPGPKPSPCVQASVVLASTRVFVQGQGVILSTSQILCKSAELVAQGPLQVLLPSRRVTVLA